jgi:hypothetical protein
MKKNPVEFSRRAFIFPWMILAELAQKIADARTSEIKTPKAETYNKAIEFFGEGLAFLTFLGLAYKGASERHVWYDVDAEMRMFQTPDFLEKLKLIDGLSDITVEIAEDLKNLQSSWRNAYERKKTSCTHTTDGDGKIVTNCKTEVYWIEPRSLNDLGLNRFTISNWRNLAGNSQNSSGDIKRNSGNAMNMSLGENNIFYKEQEVDTGKRVFGALIAFSLVGGAFVFYEEADKFAAEIGSGKPILGDDSEYVKRRTFIKAVCALIGYLGIRKVQRKFSKDNENLLDGLKDNSTEVLSQLDVADEVNFSRFFGRTPLQIREQLVAMNDIAAKAIDGRRSDISAYINEGTRNWQNVKSDLQSLEISSKTAIERFDEYFGFNAQTGEYTIPPELTELTGYLWASREIEKASKTGRTSVKIRPIIEAGALGLALTIVMATSELVVLPASDEIIDRLKRLS